MSKIRIRVIPDPFGNFISGLRQGEKDALEMLKALRGLQGGGGSRGGGGGRRSRGGGGGGGRRSRGGGGGRSRGGGGSRQASPAFNYLDALRRNAQPQAPQGQARIPGDVRRAFTPPGAENFRGPVAGPAAADRNAIRQFTNADGTPNQQALLAAGIGPSAFFNQPFRLSESENATALDQLLQQQGQRVPGATQEFQALPGSLPDLTGQSTIDGLLPPQGESDPVQLDPNLISQFAPLSFEGLDDLIEPVGEPQDPFGDDAFLVDPPQEELAQLPELPPLPEPTPEALDTAAVNDTFAPEDVRDYIEDLYL